MYVDLSFGEEGDSTTISSTNLLITDNPACVSVNVLGMDVNSGRLSIIFEYADGSEEERYLNYIDTQGRWFTEHVRFNPGLKQFHIMAARGNQNGGIIAIDDIMILDDNKCIGKCL